MWTPSETKQKKEQEKWKKNTRLGLGGNEMNDDITEQASRVA